MMRRVFEQLNDHAQRSGERLAVAQVTPLCAGAVSMSYRELHGAVSALRQRLMAMHRPADVIALCAYNRPEFVVGYLAALAADLTVFPLYPGIADAELREALIRADARGFLGLAERFEPVADLPLQFVNLLDAAPISGDWQPLPVQCENAAMYLQSSGTTGSPKIVRRTGASLDAVASNVAYALQLRHDDQVLAAIPVCHSYGVEHGVLGPMFAGCSVHLADTFDTRLIVPQIAARQITVYPGTPFMFEMLADAMEPSSAQALRLAYSAGAALPSTVAEAFHASTGVRVGQLYGSTEVGSVTFSGGRSEDDQHEHVGSPMPGVEIRILDVKNPRIAAPLPSSQEGHVAIAAPSMLERYVDDPQPALTDGYFLTGDLGRLDHRGRLFITGRVKLQIDIGGLKVNPLEVERVLQSHPAVAECVVVPAAVTATLVRLCAVVTARDPASPPDVHDLRQFARSRLSRHKVPRLFEVRDSLPRSASGKILRGAVQCA